ncbi:MAG TPA: hypothetical protein VLX64_02005 [Thermoplasmata archaeon]|nr:hypothetical protein [Thermoplasmata archaeon]
MIPTSQALEILLTAVLAVVSFALLRERTGDGRPRDGPLSRAAGRWSAPGGLWAGSWVPLAAAVAVGYAVVVAYDLTHGWYGCPAGGGPSDLFGLRGSGLAFWAGGNVFSAPDCGTSIVVPYGLAAVVLDALGSLGGSAGIAVVWGALSVALVPLVWSVAGADRRYLTLGLVASPIFFPIVAGEIDGAANAIVPFTILLAFVLARRGSGLAAAVGGLLSSARFPSLFPVAASVGPWRARLVPAIVAVAAFAAATAVAYARWRAAFVNAVFLSQATRHAYSLNAFGLLLNAHALPGGRTLPAVQAVVVVAISIAAMVYVRSPVRSAAIALAGVALTTQFLSYPILLWLVPIGLVDARARWWLWGVATVGALDWLVALNQLGFSQGIYGPTDALDLLVTGLLLGLFVELWRGARAERSGPGPAGTSGAGG